MENQAYEQPVDPAAMIPTSDLVPEAPEAVSSAPAGNEPGESESAEAPLEDAKTYAARVADESVQRAKFTPLVAEPGAEPLGKIEYLRDVDLEASVELGNAVMTVENILSLQTGSLVELKQTVGDPVRLLINGNPYALGEVVVIGEKFGVRLIKLLQAH